MNRINRVTSILIQLQSKKIIPAKEIAQRFNISLRTVYRDIRTLEEAGIPIGSEAGKGYFLVEGFLLPPVMFTAAEVGALITAGKFLNCHGDESFIKDFDSAMYKIKSILKHGEKNYAQELENSIKLFTNDRAGKAGRATWFIANRDVITRNEDYITQWQVVVSSANAGGQKRDNQLEIIDNHSAFGRSRLALYNRIR